MALRVRFYADENIPNAVIEAARQHGADAVTVSEAKVLGATDQEQLTRAKLESRVLITRDRDFLRLHAAGAIHSGIVFVNPELSNREVIRGVLLIYGAMDADEMVGHVEFL